MFQKERAAKRPGFKKNVPRKDRVSKERAAKRPCFKNRVPKNRVPKTVIGKRAMKKTPENDGKN